MVGGGNYLTLHFFKYFHCIIKKISGFVCFLRVSLHEMTSILQLSVYSFIKLYAFVTLSYE